MKGNQVPLRKDPSTLQKYTVNFFSQASPKGTYCLLLEYLYTVHKEMMIPFGNYWIQALN